MNFSPHKTIIHTCVVHLLWKVWNMKVRQMDYASGANVPTMQVWPIDYASLKNGLEIA